MPLFRRHSRGVAPTSAGRELLPYALKLRALLDEARRAVAGNAEPGDLLIPRKYTMADSSGLKAEVTSGGITADFALTKP